MGRAILALSSILAVSTWSCDGGRTQDADADGDADGDSASDADSPDTTPDTDVDADQDLEPLVIWPNEESRANSDPWLMEHHQEIQQLRPRILALNFVNARSMDEMRAQLEEMIAVMAEASRYHGYRDPDAHPRLLYELAYAIDLRDASPPDGWPYRNSTLYPREDPQVGYWGFDYDRLFTREYADLYGIDDPDVPGRHLTLCELIDRGLVHEVWIYGDGDVPDVSAAEILELKPWYDDERRRRDTPMTPCAGNGCFEPDDEIPCTRTVRIGWFNNTRGPGCFLESLSHGFESIGAWFPLILPSLSRDFIPFANYALDDRYGVPFDSWYACPYEGNCLQYPSETSVRWDMESLSGEIDPYDPVCGNVHFMPNGRRHYDLDNPASVLTTCEGFGLHEGPGGDDLLRTFSSETFAAYRDLAPDCMGPFLVYWRQSFPSDGSGATDESGRPILSFWPYIYY